jgi:RNA polymerase sigma factor (sigma-70 family)
MIDTSWRATAHEELVTLLRRAQAGDNDAATAVYQRCREPLLETIRNTITRPMRRLKDSDDFLLDTFQVIFAKHFADEVLASPQTLWPYLKRIAHNKVVDAERQRRRCELNTLALQFLAEADEPLAREAPPDEDSLFRELISERLDALIEQLPALLQDILTLLMEGKSAVQIAVTLGVEVKRVYRAIGWLERKVFETCAAEAN